MVALSLLPAALRLQSWLPVALASLVCIACQWRRQPQFWSSSSGSVAGLVWHLLRDHCGICKTAALHPTTSARCVAGVAPVSITVGCSMRKVGIAFRPLGVRGRVRIADPPPETLTSCAPASDHTLPVASAITQFCGMTAPTCLHWMCIFGCAVGSASLNSTHRTPPPRGTRLV